jgi:predicted KAP-like P-loop ATPase
MVSENINSMTFKYRDELKRKNIAENLFNLVTSENGLSPVLLDGRWGTGKTEFCQKFAELVREKNKNGDKKPNIVYIDAFIHDYSDDPMTMLISQIASAIPEGENKRNYFKNAIPIAKILGKNFLKAGINIVCKMDTDSISQEFAKAMATTGNELTDEALKNVFENQEKLNDNLKFFKQVLKNVVTEKNSLIVIVDELDRCRPTFALSILERIKHVFNVPNVHFIISMNKEQIMSVIQKQYGQSIDSESYLDKLFG